MKYNEGIHKEQHHAEKMQPLRKVMSSLRKRKRHFPIIMYTGIRVDESKNRMYNFGNRRYKRDPGAKNNIFVNCIEHWSQMDCTTFLRDMHAPVNPVAKCLHRSAECMCFTTQSPEDVALAAMFYPEWWAERQDLMRRVEEAGHTWKWTESKPRQRKKCTGEAFMCQTCLFEESDVEAYKEQQREVQNHPAVLEGLSG